MVIKKISEAPESNAGDDFHVLWTLKKSLELLNFDSNGLKAIYVEGIEKDVEESIDPTGEKFLGVDLTEYYGENSFAQSSQIIISQLKYSTRRIEENITFSELYKSKKKNSFGGSIIMRLANSFKALADEFGIDEVRKKVVIKLISNRKFNSEQLEIIKDFQQKVVEGGISLEKFISEMTSHKQSFMKIKDASGLTSDEFVIFLNLINLEECGTSPSVLLEQELIMAIGRTSVTSRHQFNSLYKLIVNKMLPNQEYKGISVIDIIANLGFTSGNIENLFPVPPKFEKIEFLIPREQVSDLAQLVNNHTDGPIIIHGGAGMGKSTITQQLAASLPNYCESIIFDCYGQGAYLNAEDRRHLHRKALLHISNEIAKKLETDFLISHHEFDDVYLTEFKKRVQSAIAILRDRNEKSYLAIIIDAADNSITAAEKFSEKSFVKDLIDIALPDGCKLIITTRTTRMKTLGLPDTYSEVEITPFSFEETQNYLAKYYPASSLADAQHFHNLTGGVPRVEYYAIDLKKQGVDEVINYLRPNGKTVEGIISGKISDAIKKIGQGGMEKVGKFFRTLAALPSPVPKSYLSELSGLGYEFMEDLATDIWNGLIYENGTFSFRDEDFETFIRNHYLISPQEKKQIAEIFIKKASIDEYASISIGSVLLEAGEIKELIEIVLDRKFLAVPEDPIQSKEIYIQRAKLAMKAAKDIEDIETQVKLFLIAALEAKTDKALTELLIKYPDLVARYGNDSSLGRLNYKSEEKTWAGSFHLKLAGTYSRIPEDKNIALKHLTTARDWLNWKHTTIDKDQYQDYPIYGLDIAYQTEARLRLHGLKAAINSLTGWSPPSIALQAGKYLLQNIITYPLANESNVKKDIRLLRTDMAILVSCSLFQNDKEQIFDLAKVAHKLIRIVSGKGIEFERDYFLIIIEFCQLLAYQKVVDPEAIVSILEKIPLNKLKTYVPHFNSKYYHQDEDLELDISLHTLSLIAALNEKPLLLEHILPEELRDGYEVTEGKQKKDYSDDKRKFVSFYKHALPIYKLDADFSAGLSGESGTSQFKELCKKLNSDGDFNYIQGHRSQERIHFLIGKLAGILSRLPVREDLLDFLMTSTGKNAGKIELRFAILDKLPNSMPWAALKLRLLHEIDNIILSASSSINAKEMTDDYIKCCLICSKIDSGAAQYYFQKAIESVSEIDYEAMSQISCLADLTEIGIPSANPKLAYEVGRFVEYCDKKLEGYDKKHFPYAQALRAIHTLHPETAYLTLSRWDSTGIVEVADHIMLLLTQSLKTGQITASCAVALLPLYDRYHYSESLADLIKLILSKLDGERNTKSKTKFVKYLLRDFSLAENISVPEMLYENVKNGQYLDKEVLAELKEYIDFQEGIIKKEEKSTYKNNFDKQSHSHGVDLRKINLSSFVDLEQVIANINGSSETYARWRVSNFLAELVPMCTPDVYIAHLDALCMINPAVLDGNDFEDALSMRLEAWTIHPNVRKWKKNNFKYVIQNWFEYFDKDSGLSLYNLDKFATMFSVDQTTLAKTIIEIVPQKIEYLTYETLLRFVDIIKSELTPEMNELVLEWTLTKWNRPIEESIALGKWDAPLEYKGNSVHVIAGLLHYLTGHPDKRVRWTALHSMRRLANMEQDQILIELSKLQDKTDCFPYTTKEFPFYNLSAKLYYYIAIERISGENPESLVSIKNDLICELVNEELPHVLIKYYIKNALTNMLNCKPEIFNKADISIIHNSLTSKFEKIPEDFRYKPRLKKISKKELIFNFNSMDTLPYWYEPLGNLFNISREEVAKEAEKFIMEDWGYKKNEEFDKMMRYRYQGSQHDLLLNRHGDIPTVESHKIYHEYHGLYCAAGALLKKLPLMDNGYIEDTWIDWLNTEANAWDGRWLSDARDSKPLQPLLWKYPKTTFNKKWRDNITDISLDKEIGLVDKKKEGTLKIYGGITRYIGMNYESVSIRSAIVSLRGADALQRALQTTIEYRDFLIPFEDDDEIDCDGFVLKGWLTESKAGYEGLDKDDPLAVHTGQTMITPGALFKTMNKTTNRNHGKDTYWNDKLVASYRNWNEITDSENRRSYDDSLMESSGDILVINIESLLLFLKTINMCLIVECVMTRELQEKRSRYRKANNDDDTEREKIKIYLIQPDGKVKTLSGKSYKLR